jgi:glycosyltransferase involved in cell wall biosynthesis
MKLYIQYELNETGKSKFISRLIPALKKRGVKIQFKEKGADVALLLTRNRDKFPKIPVAIRMDGTNITNTSGAKKRIKKKILPAMNKSKAIIYQSEFCKYMLNGIIQPKVKKQYVIYNGAHPDEFDVNPRVSEHYKNVLMSAKWFDGKHHRDYKRLRQMWEIAVRYVTIHSGNTCFWIAGETGGVEKQWPKNDRIKFVGHLSDRPLKHYLKMADIYLHMPWYSWCDNSLIEAITAGCIPIVSNVGGNAEVVEDCGGMILDVDQKLAAKRTNNGPPPLNVYTVTDAISHVFNTNIKLNQRPIHIDTIARKYKQVFEELL